MSLSLDIYIHASYTGKIACDVTRRRCSCRREKRTNERKKEVLATMNEIDIMAMMMMIMVMTVLAVDSCFAIASGGCATIMERSRSLW